MKRRVSFKVRGRVQGVAFRITARDEADRLGVTGYIRNRNDGAVEGEAEGEATAVDAFLAWCAKGPLGARVEHLQVDDLKLDGPFDRFEIRR